jgi:RNA recognition motif-containing protein
VNKKIYVGNLSFSTTEDELRQTFSTYGKVESAAIVSDRMSGQSRGFGFVEMGSEDAARAAITALDGHELGGRQLKVSEAKERTGGGRDRPSRGGGGGGGGGYDRDRY